MHTMFKIIWFKKKYNYVSGEKCNLNYFYITIKQDTNFF